MSPVQPKAASDSARVGTGEKLAYGAGGMTGAFHNIGTVYLLEPVFVVTLGLSPAIMAICGVVSRLWDAITDMLMGWISDNTRTRWGRRRPFVFIGAILSALWMPLIWLVNPGWSKEVFIAWLFGGQIVLLAFTTMWNIPYQCLLMEVSPDPINRTRVAAFRQYFGTAAWLVMGWSWYLSQNAFFGPGDGTSDLINGAFWVTSAVAVLVLVTGVLPALFCKERLYAAASGQAKVTLRHTIKQTLRHRPFLWLIICTLLFWVGTQAKNGLAFYTRLYFVCDGDQQLAAKITGIESTLTLCIGLACIPFFERIARLRGRRAALSLVLWITLFASISTLFTYNPAYPYLSILSGALLAPANSAVWVLLPSLLGDVVDHDELHSGERRDGAFAAVFSWTFKLSQTLASGMSGWLVVTAGFEVAAKVAQTPETLLTMRVLLALVPLVCLGAGLFALRRLPLTPETIADVQADLALKRHAATATPPP
jgi:glycoside/pentoside/hexuronide:cation symporter, GPH family